MLKTYTIKEKTQKVITSRKVSLHFILEDKEGQQRKIIAIAKLGLRKKIKSIQPIYHRETPLVEALLEVSVNDVIEVDFSEFNRKNPRISPALSKSCAAKKLKEAHALPFFTFGMFDVDPYRVLQLFIMATIGIVAFIAI